MKHNNLSTLLNFYREYLTDAVIKTIQQDDYEHAYHCAEQLEAYPTIRYKLKMGIKYCMAVDDKPAPASTLEGDFKYD